jgi:hypothetical protein
MAKTANDVIPISIFRQVIQDTPKDNYQVILTDGENKVFQLENFPVITDLATTPLYPFSIELTDITPDELGEYKLSQSSGLLRFTTAPPVGTMEVNYFSAQITDEEISYYLNNALIQHDHLATWDTFPADYSPYVIWLAAASCFYSLASKWAIETRIRVETVEIHNADIAAMYYKLARRMEDRYNDACAGIITVSTLTRRDTFTNMLIPFPEDVFNNDGSVKTN